MVARRVIVGRCDTPLCNVTGVGFRGFRLSAESSRGRVERHRVDVENFSPKLKLQSYAKSLIFTTPQLRK